MNSKRVFITGVTGLIAGETLAQLLADPVTKGFSYTALIRDENKAEKIKELGVTPIIGTIEDSEVLVQAARNADIVIHSAKSSDHALSARAIIAGLSNRDDSPIYIHLSGTGLLCEDARGEYAGETIYSDLKPEQINNLPKESFHRNVDLLVAEASEHGIRTHIVLPSTVYGIADNILVQKGIANPVSMQMPLLIKAGIARGQAGILGKGENLWPNIHITETGSLIVTILKAALEGKTATGWEGYYFGESGEYRQRDACEKIAKALHSREVGSTEPTKFSQQELVEYFGPVDKLYGQIPVTYYLGTNSRCRGDRVRALGWYPTHTNEDFLNSLEPEVEYIIRKQAENHK